MQRETTRHAQELPSDDVSGDVRGNWVATAAAGDAGQDRLPPTAGTTLLDILSSSFHSVCLSLSFSHSSHALVEQHTPTSHKNHDNTLGRRPARRQPGSLERGLGQRRVRPPHPSLLHLKPPHSHELTTHVFLPQSRRRIRTRTRAQRPCSSGRRRVPPLTKVATLSPRRCARVEDQHPRRQCHLGLCCTCHFGVRADRHDMACCAQPDTFGGGLSSLTLSQPIHQRVKK